MEQEEYRKEKIDWSYVEFVDNQDVLDLIEKVLLTFPLNMLTYFYSCIVWLLNVKFMYWLLLP